jgi:hypothetical protein
MKKCEVLGYSSGVEHLPSIGLIPSTEKKEKSKVQSNYARIENKRQKKNLGFLFSCIFSEVPNNSQIHTDRK